MTIDEYSKQALSTLTSKHEYGEVSAQLMSVVLGLGGESGEILEKFKKILREKKGVIGESDKEEIVKELGDVLWYLNSLSTLIGSSLEEVAQKNNEKLKSRKARNQLYGSGDNR